MHDLTVVDRLVAATNPTSVLEVTAGTGALATAFRERGVEAQALEVKAAEAPEIAGRYSLVTLLGVVERLAAADAQQLLDAVCAATDRVLFAAAGDYADPAQVNVHDAATWAQWFAERGLFRRADVNLGFVSADAVLFERAAVELAAVVRRYESLLAPAAAEARGKGEALQEAHRDIAALHDEITSLKLGGPDPEKVDRLAAEVASLQAELSQARYDQLTVRDHIIGLEAENERLTDELDRARVRATGLRTRLDDAKKRLVRQQRTTRQLRRQVEETRTKLVAQRRVAQARGKELAAVRASRSWKLGRALLRPFGAFRR